MCKYSSWTWKQKSQKKGKRSSEPTEREASTLLGELRPNMPSAKIKICLLREGGCYSIFQYYYLILLCCVSRFSLLIKYSVYSKQFQSLQVVCQLYVKFWSSSSVMEDWNEWWNCVWLCQYYGANNHDAVF